MRLRVKVYNTQGQVHNRLDLVAPEETAIPQVLEDIEGFLREQFIEIEEGEDE